jgi:hypothetical protein
MHSMDRSTWNFVQLITSANGPNVPKIVWIGSVDEAPQTDEILAQNICIYLSLLVPYVLFSFPLEIRSLNRLQNLLIWKPRSRQLFLKDRKSENLNTVAKKPAKSKKHAVVWPKTSLLGVATIYKIFSRVKNHRNTSFFVAADAENSAEKN